MPLTGSPLRPRHLCSMALMSVAAFAALAQQSAAAAGPGPVAVDALTGPQPAGPAFGHAAPYQPPVSQRLRAYEARKRPYAPRHVRRHIYPVVVEQPVQEAPEPSPSPAPSPLPSPVRQAPVTVAQQADGSAQAYAESLVGSAQFSCLDPLWERESGWDVTAENPSSGAYGIPQALPGYKMASAGPDWQSDADTQIRWGISYIDSTYGSPCGAWQHEKADGWY